MILLIFIHSLHSGGAERVTSNLANQWAEKGWNVTVVTMESISRDFYKLHPAVKRIALNMAGESGNAIAAMVRNLQRVRALRQVLKQVKPDAALAMMNTANILLALAAIGLKELITVGSERNYPPHIPLGHAWGSLRAYVYGNLDAVVAQTQESAIWLQRNTRAINIPIIANAVYLPLPVLKPYLKVPDQYTGEFILLAVGRLVQQKGFDLLIRTFQNLAQDFPNWNLVILGDGPERQKLQSQIALAGLEDRVRLPGRAGNVGEWYKAADLYVMSSRSEGFPNTLAEAMAHGLPVISFDCDTGPRDMIRNGINGLLVPTKDIAALETAMRELMKSEIRRNLYAVMATQILKQYSPEIIMTKWEDLLKQLIKSKKSQS